MPAIKRNNGKPITGPITLVVGDTLRLKLDGVRKNAAEMNHFILRADTPSSLTISQNPNPKDIEQVITLTANNTTELVTVRAFDAAGNAKDCGELATCVRSLQITIVPKIILPDLNSDEGALVRLLLAETPNPSHPLYVNSDEAMRTMQYMRIVIENRLAAAKSSPTLRRYVASGPATLDFRGIITARQHGVQFEGFASYPTIGAKQTSTINECVNTANDGTNRLFENFRRYVEDAITVAKGPDLGGTITTPDILYFWRTVGSGSPSRYAVKQITLGGQDFYSLSESFLSNPNNPN